MKNNYGYDDSARLQLHVERAIEMVNGEVPVYVQTFLRYKVDSTGYRNFHDVSEFTRDQVQSSLDAVWTDSDGKEHRINGVSLWDAFVYAKYYTENWSELSMDERKALWDEIDLTHLEYLPEMKALVDIAAEAANQRLADAQAEASEKETELTTNSSTSSQQQSRFVRQLDDTQAATSFMTASFRSSPRSYRSARRAWTQARRMFSAATRKYSRGSSQFQRAYESYLQARDEMQVASRSYRQDRDSDRSTRAMLNQAKDQWKSANTDVEDMENTEQTLLATK